LSAASFAVLILSIPLPQDANGATEALVYSFCSQTKCTDGNFPLAGVIDVKGTLYGTTDTGGNYGGGTVFSVDPGTGIETVLHSFGSVTDGRYPSYGSLIDVTGTLYGTTLAGGANCQDEGGCGTVFSVDATTGAEAVLYSFCARTDCTDGLFPYAGLLDVKGTLFGTTYAGGANCGDNGLPGCGTVFSLSPGTGIETVLHSFGSGADGRYPFYGALIDVKGTLYGTTLAGGANCQEVAGCGTIFSVDATNGAETVLHSFCARTNCSDGLFPYAGLLDMKGTLFGTTYAGGANCGDNGLPGCGTVFSLDPGTGTETALYSFCARRNCKDGAGPVAGLTDAKGTLYSTTPAGGAHEAGTVFSLDPGTGTETVLYSFCSRNSKHEGCTDGMYPSATATFVGGTLYGTTLNGGIYDWGTVFALTP
jgi:uncharacterized repeat protein (TIGR03803 family)